MSQPNVSSNAGDTGKQTPEPVMTPTIKEASDKRMGMLAKSFMVNAPGTTGIVPDMSSNSRPEPQSKDATQPKKDAGADQQPTEVKPKPTETPKADDKAKPTEKKDEPVQPAKETPPAKKKLTFDELEEERRKHQARADKAEAELAKITPEKTAWEAERTELLKSKELVDQFTKDPVTFMQQRFPELTQKIAVAGDPVKMIEAEVGAYHAQLEKAFKTELGEDWRYSEAESLRPGTPSFRFRLAIQSKTDESRNKVSDYINSQRRNQEEIKRREVDDKKQLAEEYGFTEDHFKKADEILRKEGITYRNLVRLALIDDIIQQKLDKVVPAPAAPKDIADTRGASSEQDREEKPTLSKDGKRMASRLPIRQSV